MVRRTLFGAQISREGWEALWEGDSPSISDAQLELENVFELIRRQGRIAAELAFSDETREDLNGRHAAAIKRLPLWLTASVHGPSAAPPEAIVRDFAELLGAHRESILQVAYEQVVDPEEIEDLLADAPVPDRDEDDLAAAVGRVIRAHSATLVLIAIDWDTRFAEPA